MARRQAEIRKTELVWIAYRDAECSFVSGTFGEGSAAPMVCQQPFF